MSDFQKIISDLKNKKYAPVYFLMGEEPFYIDKITQYIEDNVLQEHEKEFNQTILYGRDTDVWKIIENAKRFPMMSDKQVVIVKEAQFLKDLDLLKDYIKNPLDSTILVIAYKLKTVDKRKKDSKEFFDCLQKNAVIFDSKPLKDSQIPAWIVNVVQSKGYAITEKSSFLLYEFLGNDLSKILNELDKLCINLPSKTTINESHIEEFVGISKEYNNFELQKSIASKNVSKAMRIAYYFSKNPKDYHVLSTTAILFLFFSKVFAYQLLSEKSKTTAAKSLKVNPYYINDYIQASKLYSGKKVAEIISILREYDAKSKGVDSNASSSELIIELVYKILN